jgi:hypothetical protein
LLIVTVRSSLPGASPVPIVFVHGFGAPVLQVVVWPFTAHAAAAAIGLRRNGISSNDGASEIARERTGLDMRITPVFVI